MRHQDAVRESALRHRLHARGGLGWANDAQAAAKTITCPKGEKRTFEEAYRILVAKYGAESQQAKDAARQIEITRGMKGKG